jgi:tetratricopeptide (TPR) repeat protein
MYWAAVGAQAAGDLLVAGHLRDGDVGGAVGAVSELANDGQRKFVHEELRSALFAAGAEPTEEGYAGVIGALLGEAKKIQGLDEPMGDAILGVSLAAVAAHPRSTELAEVLAHGLLFSGAGDAAPAILSHALLGTADDPRRPAAKDLGRALTISASAIRDYADREDFEGARRTYKAASPLLLAADEVGGVSPTSAEVKTLMAIVEGEAGQPTVARSLFDEALAAEALPVALAGRARIDARDGDLGAARARLDKAIASPRFQEDLLIAVDIRTMAGDFARRAGDQAAARGHYEEALRLLAAARAKGTTAPDVARRAERVYSRFLGMTDKEDDAASVVEAGNDAKAATYSVLHRFLRALRGPDAPRARVAFRRAMDLGLQGEDLVRAAILARAIAKRANVTPDPDVSKVLTAASAHDDPAGRLARFALGTLDAKTLVAKAGTPRHTLYAKLAIALATWSSGDTAAAKPALEEVARAEILGTLETELALEMLEPDKAVLPGVTKN